MADYSPAQLKAMQEEATRRVREMNKRSKNVINRNNENNRNNDKRDIIKEAKVNQDNHKTATVSQVKHKNPLNFLQSLDLKKLISGGEQSMILLLILLLMNDNANDDYLIYALIYIML